MYNVKSNKATEFINHEEILETLKYAEENKNNKTLINELIEKARNCKGLSHREAAVLLECDLEEENNKIYSLAKEIKEKFYGNRIVMFAPLYLSNYCVNGCTYCPYHFKNKHIPRKKLTQEEIKREVIALQDMGHKRLALETGEDPINNPIEYVLESIKTIYSIKHKNGAIRRVNVNIAATTVENYKKLKEAGIGTYILFQETYNKEAYEELHPTGPKHDYAYHTEAMDRAMDGGIDDVGCGVLFGLNLYRYDFVGLLMHAEHLEAAKGVGPHTISVPRIRPADDINPDEFANAISDEIFAKIVAVLRIAVPYTGLIVSTRESQKTAPLLDEFQEYVEREIKDALPKSPLGKALDYTNKVLPGMKTLLLDGSLEIDNNGAERAIKPFVIGRKNWLFSNTSKGAKSSATIYSIIETAKANGLIVEKYLVYLFDKISEINIDNKEILLDIMPWSKKLPPELRASPRK